MKKIIILVVLGIALSSCAKTKDWPEWARQDRDSNGAESHVQGRRGIGPGAIDSIQGMFGEAMDRANGKSNSGNQGK